MAVDPSTGHEFAELPETSAELVGEMVEDAHRALAVEHEWRTPLVRAKALTRLARRIEAEERVLSELETRDTGKPLKQAKADVAATARYLDYYAGSIERLEGRQIPLGPDVLDYTVREPWGVCAQIIPWNYPLQVTARCAAPALAAGQRGDRQAVRAGVGDAAALRRVRRGGGRAARDDPGRHRRRRDRRRARRAPRRRPRHVRRLAPPPARRVAEACARRLAPIELELGGKSPNVVFADADLDKAIPAIVNALIQNAGQSCSAGTRLLVERAAFDDVDRARRRRAGAGDDRPRDRGPGSSAR